MVKEISCPKGNLENFILYGEQIPFYKFIHGEPDKRKVDKKTIDYYYKGKKYAEQFQGENAKEEFMASLKTHIGMCHECSKTFEEIRKKYNGLEKLNKLTNRKKSNLKYFKVID